MWSGPGGQESYIDSTLKTAEVFPNEYNVSWKDRNIHGGGVFVAVSKKYGSTTAYSLNTKCEVLWCKFTIAGTKPLYEEFVSKTSYIHPDMLLVCIIDFLL